MTAREKPNVRFGPFELDLQTGEVAKCGHAIRLQTQPVQVLTILLETPGELVTREQLRNRLWTSDTFVDFDHSLNTAIKKLRLALEDDAENPIFIETLPKRGYRFIGHLEDVSACPVSIPAEGRTPTAVEPVSTKRTRSIVLGASTLAILLAVLAIVLRPSSPPPRISPVSGLPGNFECSSFSPDGERIAFVQWERLPGVNDADESLYVQSIRDGSLIKLAEQPGRYSCPRWSADGRYIGFTRVSGSDAGIYVVPSIGGSERQLLPLRPWNGGFDWSPDGTHFIYSDSDSPQNSVILHRVQLATMKDEIVPTGTNPPIGPQYSPDGRWIAFGINPIVVIPAAGGEPKRVTSVEDAFVHGYCWTPDSKEIVFGADHGGWAVGGLWRVSIATGKRKTVLAGNDLSSPAISLKQNRLAYLSLIPFAGSIFRQELPTPENPTPPPAKRLISSSQIDEGGQISPDGRKIVFQSTRNGGYYEIWMADSDGSNPVQLTNFRGGMVGTPRWSPDSQWISFGHEGVYVLNVNGGIPRKLSVCSGISSWSHDGKWIYCDVPEKDNSEIWKVPVGMGEARQITRSGGFSAFESSNGQYVYLSKWATAGVFRIPSGGGEEVKIISDPPPHGWGYWSLSDDGIYYLVLNTDRSSEIPYWLEFFDFATKTTRRIAPIRHRVYLGDPGISISPDRTWMIYRGIERIGQTRLMYMENFH